MKQFLLKSWLTMLCLLVFGGGSAWGDSWTRCTAVSDLTSGGTFIIGYEATANSGKIIPMKNTDGTATTSAAGYMAYGSEINMATVTATTDYEFSIVASTTVTGAICIKAGNDFIGNTNTKNNCKLFTEEAATTSFGVTVGTNDVFTLKIAANKDYHTLQYNASSPRFAVYGGTQKNLVIYKKTTSSGDTPTPEPTKYEVTIANNIANGTVTASPTSAKQGDEITLTATPSTGYEFGSWNVTNASTSAAITVTNNKFKMPAANVNVSATFNEIQGGGEDTPTGSLVYKKVTSQDDIVDGGVYIIVCESQNTAMGSQNTNRRNNASITISDNSISLNSVNTENSPYEVTLTKDGDIYKMQLSNNNYLGNGAGSNNYLKEVQNYAIGYGWTLTYNTDKTVTMKTNHTPARYLCVNTANADSYATYTSIGSYEKVTLYKKETSTPDNPVDPTPAGGTINFVATTGDGKYYATFSSDRAIKFDEAFINDDESCAAAIKAYAIAIVGGQIYRTDQCKKNNDGNYTYIPANTGILFEYSLEEGTFDGAVPFKYADAEAAYLNKVEDNMLVPCPTTGACPTVEGNNYYYKLAYGDNTNKTKLGFWWGAEDGSGNFKVKAGGAVLCVPQSAGAKLSGFVFGDEDANSINNIPVLDKKATIYNLNGQRVSANAKGIVIVNGKKVLNK